MDDLITGGPRIKLYTKENGNLKGDALVVYLRPESVQLAVDLLDDSPLRDNMNIHVQPAEFHHHQSAENSDNTTSKPLRREEWKKRMEMMNKRLDWGEDELKEQRALVKQLQNECIAIIKNMLPVSPAASLELEVEQDALEESSKFGECKVITMGDRGIIAVKYKNREAAKACVQKMHGRYYCRRKLEAHVHDGSFKIKNTRDTLTEEERLEEFSKWIEQDEKEEDAIY